MEQGVVGRCVRIFRCRCCLPLEWLSPLLCIISTCLYYAVFGTMLGAADELRILGGDLAAQPAWELDLFWWLPSHVAITALAAIGSFLARAEPLMCTIAAIASSGAVMMMLLTWQWLGNPTMFILLGISGLCSGENDLSISSKASGNPEETLCGLLGASWLLTVVTLIILSCTELVMACMIVKVWQQVFNDKSAAAERGSMGLLFQTNEQRRTPSSSSTTAVL